MIFIKQKIKFLYWFGQWIRKSNSVSDPTKWLQIISDKLSLHFLKKLEKKLVKNRKFCKKIFNLYEYKIWLLIQHADSIPSLQNSYLSLFKLFGKNKSYIAHLEDRVLVNYKGVQKYGTQIVMGLDYHHYLIPIIGLDTFQILDSLQIKSLNQRRASMNLEPIEEYIDSLEKTSGIFLRTEILKIK